MNPENGTPYSGEAYLSSEFIRDAWYVAAWDHEVGPSGVRAPPPLLTRAPPDR